MIPGETIATGAAPTCGECGVTPELAVYCSTGGAGYYIGTYCQCGPYSRESEYFKTRALADDALARWHAGNKKEARSAAFNEEGAKTLRAEPLDWLDPNRQEAVNRDGDD